MSLSSPTNQITQWFRGLVGHDISLTSVDTTEKVPGSSPGEIIHSFFWFISPMSNSTLFLFFYPL